jgi:hypothetical protein
MLASLTKGSSGATGASRIIPTSVFAAKRPAVPVVSAAAPVPAPAKTDPERICHFVDAPITYTDSNEAKVTKNVRRSHEQKGGGSHTHQMKQGEESGKKFALFYCVVKDCGRKWWLPHADVPKALAGADISTGEEGCATDEEAEEDDEEEQQEEEEKEAGPSAEPEEEQKEAAKSEDEEEDEGEKEYEPPVEKEKEEEKEVRVNRMESASDDDDEEEKEKKEEAEVAVKRKPGRPKKGEEKPKPPVADRAARAAETRKHPVYVQITDERCIEHPSFNHRKKDREEEIDRIRMSLQCLNYDEMQSWMKAEWKLPKYATCETGKERVWRFREAVQDKINDFCRDKKSKKTMTTFDQHASEFGDSDYNHDDRRETRVAMLYEVKRLDPDTMKFTAAVFEEDMDLRTKAEAAEEEEDEEMRVLAEKAAAENEEDEEEEDGEGEEEEADGEETDEDKKIKAASDAESSEEEEEEEEQEEEKVKGKKASVGSKRKRSVKGKGKGKGKGKAGDGKKKTARPAKKKPKVGGRPNNASIRESFDQLKASNEKVLAVVNKLVKPAPDSSKDDALVALLREFAGTMEVNQQATSRALDGLRDDVCSLGAELRMEIRKVKEALEEKAQAAASKTVSSSSSAAKPVPTPPKQTAPAPKPGVVATKQTVLTSAVKK